MKDLIPIVLTGMLLVLGLSYLLQTRRWILLTRHILAKPERLFPFAILLLLTGITIGAGYDNWVGTWPIFITALGWLIAIEAAAILIFPGLIQKLQNCSDQFLNIYIRSGGVIVLILGILLWRNLPDL